MPANKALSGRPGRVETPLYYLLLRATNRGGFDERAQNKRGKTNGMYRGGNQTQWNPLKKIKLRNRGRSLP